MTRLHTHRRAVVSCIVIRDFQNGDFGEDLLQAHCAEVPHDGLPAPPLLAAR